MLTTSTICCGRGDLDPVRCLGAFPEVYRICHSTVLGQNVRSDYASPTISQLPIFGTTASRFMIYTKPQQLLVLTWTDCLQHLPRCADGLSSHMTSLYSDERFVRLITFLLCMESRLTDHGSSCNNTFSCITVMYPTILTD